VGHVEQWLAETLAEPLSHLPADLFHFFGEDFGRTADRTVIAPGYLDQGLRRVCPFAVELLNVPYDQQRQILFYVVDRLPRLIGGAMDATGNGGALAEACVTRYGHVPNEKTKKLEPKVKPIMITDPWYAAMLPRFKAAFEDRLLVLPRDADHLMDLSSFRLINGVPKLPKAKTNSSGEGPPRHGDAGVAYLMMHVASNLPLTEVGYEAAPRARKTLDGLDVSVRRGIKLNREQQLTTGSGGFKHRRGVL
jgi:phage FluMu gp28-like protein